MITGERLVELSPLSTGTALEHLLAIVVGTGGGTLADIIGYVNSKGISAKMINEELSVGSVSVSGASGTVDNPETITGSISKKIIR